jgi:hypothetical protein
MDFLLDALEEVAGQVFGSVAHEVWRDMKGVLELRQVFHHREDRIRAHVQLCWLALLHQRRVVENATGDTWRNVRHELDRMYLVTLATNDGQVAQRCTTTAGQKTILAALQLPEPTVLRLHRPQQLTPPAGDGERVVVTRPPGPIQRSAGHRHDHADRVLIICGSRLTHQGVDELEIPPEVELKCQIRWRVGFLEGTTTCCRRRGSTRMSCLSVHCVRLPRAPRPDLHRLR